MVKLSEKLVINL